MPYGNAPAADLASFQAAIDNTPAEAPVKGGEISTVARARIAADEAAAEAAGFALPPPIFAAGTRVVDIGDRNFVAERNAVESLPLYHDAHQHVVAEIRCESRRDVEVPMANLRADEKGLIRRVGHENKPGLLLEPRAFSAFCTRAGFGKGAAYLRDLCGPELRAHNLNFQFLGMAAGTGPQAKLRTRLDARGKRSIFATVSPGYTAYDADQFLRDAAPALADAHAEIVYNPADCSLRADAFWLPDHVVDLAAGDVFKAGVRLRTSDDGSGSIRVEAVLFRNRCLNLIIIGQASVETVRQRHVGNAARISEAVQAGVAEAREKIGHFLGQWGKARTITVDFEEELATTVNGAIKAGVPRTAGERLKAAIATSYAKEPGQSTVADVTNAITRAAHEETWNQTQRDTLESYASEYLTQTVAA